MDYGTAARTVVDHQPRQRRRWQRWRPERCRVCRSQWPCRPRRQAGRVIVERAAYVR